MSIIPYEMNQLMNVVLFRGMMLGLGAAVPIGPVNVQLARRVLHGGFRAGFALGGGAVTADVTYAALSSLSFARLLTRPWAVNSIGVAGALLLTYLGVACLRAAVKAWRAASVEGWDGGEGLTRGHGDAGTRGPNDAKCAIELGGDATAVSASLRPRVSASASAPDSASASHPVSASASPPDSASASSPPAAHSNYITGLLMTLLNPMTLAFWFAVVPAATAAASPDNAKRTQEAAINLPITCAGVFIGTLAWVVTFSGLLAWAGRRRKTWWLVAADIAGGATLLFFAVATVWRVARPHL